MPPVSIEDIISELPSDVQEILAQSYGHVTEDTFSDLNAEANKSNQTSNLQAITQQDLENLANVLQVDFPSAPVQNNEIEEVNEDVVVQEQDASIQQLSELPPSLALTETVIETPEITFNEVELVRKISVADNVKANVYDREAVLALGIKDHALRFSEASWYKNLEKLSVSLVGAGGISSWCGVMLAKLNIKSLLIFDGDKYDVNNIAGQLFMYESIGENKADALGRLCKAVNPYSNINIFSQYMLINPSNGTSRNGAVTYGILPIMFVGVDNMVVRRAIFEAWWQKFGNESVPGIFIDGRLAAESYQLYTVRNDDIIAKDRYLAEWFSDDKGDELACSYKQTSFVAANLASRMVAHFVNSFISEDAIPRVVPFYVEVTPYYEKIINYATE